jgi:hypothetical protein
MPSSGTTSDSANGPAETEHRHPAGSRGQETRQPAGGEIDLHELAKKIYHLLKEEARLERERLGRRQVH